MRILPLNTSSIAFVVDPSIGCKDRGLKKLCKSLSLFLPIKKKELTQAKLNQIGSQRAPLMMDLQISDHHGN